MAYSNAAIKGIKDLVKSSRASHRLALLFRHDIWKRARWALLRDHYKKKFEPYLFCGGSMMGGAMRPAMLKCETVNMCTYECVFCPHVKMDREKKVMEMDLFEKVLGDYSRMGGGMLCLTPTTGDVFLDPHLLERVGAVKKYENITNLNFTTNGATSHQLTDEELRWLLENIMELHVSVYGIDGEEHRIITRKDDYEKVTENTVRIIKLSGDPSRVKLDFRLFKKRSYGELNRWIRENIGAPVQYEVTSTYGNWGGGLETNDELPLEGRWIDWRKNTGQCIIPLVGGMVQVDGNVSFCHCIDYNGFKEFTMGNITDKGLGEMYASSRLDGLWNFEEEGPMPAQCVVCTFHKPFFELPSYMRTRLVEVGPKGAA